METIAVILIIAMICDLITQNWDTIWHFIFKVGAIGFVGFVIYSIIKAIIENEKDRQAAEAAEEAQEAREAREWARRQAAEAAERQRHREEQQGYCKQMIDLGEQSICLFESMPNYLRDAERYLDKAKVDFAARAFVPFWESIENAAKKLGHFNRCIQEIKKHLSCHTDLIKKYEDTPPQFPLAPQSVTKLGVGKTTAERMKTIVRTAQCDFEFTNIYLQYKTNQILIAGFNNLAQALDEMTWRITASIDDLAGTLDESTRAIHSRVGDIVEGNSQHHDELMKETSKAASRERKALEMLDNIQRGRRP